MTRCLKSRMNIMCVAAFIVTFSSIPLIILPSTEPGRNLVYPLAAI